MPIKGQTLSAESIAKMKKAKLDRIVSKYNWIIAEPYMDVEIKNGSTKRTNQYITLREFRQNIDNGLSSTDMAKIGVSKKIVQFFSNFCQGKIKLTKDQFEEDYLTGKSMEEICEEHKVSREDLTYLRQMYNIKRKGATFINRKKTEVSLTQRQKEILYGSLMGDAKRQHTKWNSSAGFVQSDKQKDYLMWKFLEFANIVSENALRYSEDIDKRSGNLIKSYRFYTMANTDVEEIINKFYVDGKKIVTQEILDNLTPLSMAVWHMDDGYANFYGEKKTRTGWNITPEVKLCTDSFSPEENQLICDWLKERYDIDAHVRAKRNRVIIKSTSVYDFFALIRPHIIPSMLYKIGEK